MMTFKQIRNKTPKNRITKAQSVKLIDVKYRKNPDGFPMALAKTKSSKTSAGDWKKQSATNKYVTSLEILPKGYVVMSCSCDDFMFTWEVALNKQGAARIEYSNGKMPNDRNPSHVPGCCGHLVALGDYLIESGKI